MIKASISCLTTSHYQIYFCFVISFGEVSHHILQLIKSKSASRMHTELGNYICIGSSCHTTVTWGDEITKTITVAKISVVVGMIRYKRKKDIQCFHIKCGWSIA